MSKVIVYIEITHESDFTIKRRFGLFSLNQIALLGHLEVDYLGVYIYSLLVVFLCLVCL